MGIFTGVPGGAEDREARPRGPKAKELGPLGRLPDPQPCPRLWGEVPNSFYLRNFTRVDNCGEEKNGAGNGIRTRDPQLGRLTL